MVLLGPGEYTLCKPSTCRAIHRKPTREEQTGAHSKKSDDIIDVRTGDGDLETRL